MIAVLSFLRRWFVLCSFITVWFSMRPAQAQSMPAMPTAPSPLPVLRMPNLAIGTRCFGFLPCTPIERFGLRLRAAALVAFRPERAHERDLYAARIQLTPSITLMEWAEIGIAIPITLYKKDSGVTPIYEPLAPFGRVRIPSEWLLGGRRRRAAHARRRARGCAKVVASAL